MKTLWALVYFINTLGSEKLSVEQEVKLLSEQETRREFSVSLREELPLSVSRLTVCSYLSYVDYDLLLPIN